MDTQDTHKKLNEITSHIPDFKVTKEYDHGAYISNDKTGMEIFIRLTGGHGGKGNAYMSWPRDENNTCMSARCWSVVSYGESGPTCSFTPTKDAIKIARDITYKVITPGEPLLVKALAKLKERVKAKEAREYGINTLGKLIGEKPYGDGEEIVTKFYDESENDNRTYLEVKAGHDTFNVNISYLSLEHAMALVEMVEDLA